MVILYFEGMEALVRCTELLNQHLIYLTSYQDVMRNYLVRVTVTVVLAVMGTGAVTSILEQEVRAPISVRVAPPAITDDNVYVAW